jgi:aminoglycoside phosphotransferase (APT) family kinase protein
VLDLTPEELTSLARCAFPGVRVVSAEQLPDEHANVLYHLALDNQIEATLKLYTDATLGDGPARESKLLRLLTSETGVPVPRVLHFDAAGTQSKLEGQENVSWALLTRLPGKSLAPMIDALDAAELEALGYEAGRYLAHVHTITLSRFGEIYAPGPSDHLREKGYLVAQATEWLDRCAQAQLLPEHSRSALYQRLAETDLLDRRQPCLTHGGLRARDIIVERGLTGRHVTGFTDFSAALGAAPELDMALLFGCDLTGAPEMQRGFLDGYVEAGDLGASFWERLALYQAFAALGKLVTVHHRGERDAVRLYLAQIERVLERDPHSGGGNLGPELHV